MKASKILKLITFIIFWIYFIFWYANEIVPKDMSNQGWFAITSYLVGVFLVFIVPALFLGKYIDQEIKKEENEQ